MHPHPHTHILRHLKTRQRAPLGAYAIESRCRPARALLVRGGCATGRQWGRLAPPPWCTRAKEAAQEDGQAAKLGPAPTMLCPHQRAQQSRHGARGHTTDPPPHTHCPDAVCTPIPPSSSLAVGQLVWGAAAVVRVRAAHARARPPLPWQALSHALKRARTNAAHTYVKQAKTVLLFAFQPAKGCERKWWC